MMNKVPGDAEQLPDDEELAETDQQKMGNRGPVTTRVLVWLL